MCSLVFEKWRVKSLKKEIKDSLLLLKAAFHYQYSVNDFCSLVFLVLLLKDKFEVIFCQGLVELLPLLYILLYFYILYILLHLHTLNF